MAGKFCDLNPDGCQRLVSAVVVTAAKDYKRSLKKLKEDPNSKAAKMQIKEIEDFFYSAWYRVLSDIDADTILDGLRREVNGDDE